MLKQRDVIQGLANSSKSNKNLALSYNVRGLPA
jgi:hypothetical protein